MKSLSGVVLGLTVVFGCLLLALVCELYYLLWWKKRATNRSIEEWYCIRSSGSPAKELLHIFCLKRPSSVVSQSAFNPQETYPPSPNVNDSRDEQLVQSNDIGDGKDLLVKPLEQDTVEAELTRLHKLVGPPRFLFTIVKETREDLFNLEDGRSRKSSRGRSLTNLLVALETPYLTPIASPALFTPLLTPTESGYSQHGFNPLFESSSYTEFNRVRASPPPEFKFLEDAEEKLRRKMTVEDTQRSGSSHGQEFSIRDHSLEPMKDEEDDSFITIVVDKSRERIEHNQKHNYYYRSESS